MVLLTKTRLLRVRPGEPFATGRLITAQGRLSTWVAKKGRVNDWAIYHGEQSCILQIMEHGSKIFNKEEIKRLVPCNKTALNLYRQ